MSTTKLFSPIRIGDMELQHRVCLAPLTRFRATATTHVPLMPVVKEYYKQRTHTPGTFLISEATIIAAKAGGLPSVPGAWSEEQIAAWREITDVVHGAGCYMFLQQWALGRVAYHDVLTSEDPSLSYVSASDVQLTGYPKPPRPLTVDEIQDYINTFARVAKDAIQNAGFDGVEIHANNGCLVDQFLQDVSNKRTDQYGGSIENRARFALEILEAVTNAVGQKKTAIRISPWSTYQDMRMENPIPTFSYLVRQIKTQFPDLAYLHIIEPRIAGDASMDVAGHGDSNEFIREIWAPRPMISAGGFTREKAIEFANNEGNLIAFGRQFISNPDLVKKLKENAELTPYDRETFYLFGDASGRGYTDYPIAG